MENLRNQTVQILEEYGFSNVWAIVVQSVITFAIILAMAWLIDKLATFIMRRTVPKLVGHTATQWDDIFMENLVFAKFAHFLPGLLVLSSYNVIASESLRWLIQTLISTYFIVVLILFLNAVLNAIEQLYIHIKGTEIAIKIYIQLAKVILYSLGAVAIISIFANKKFY